MFDISKYFTRGLRNTILAKPGLNFSYKGPWTQIFKGEAIDRWFVGDFLSAEYTITIELDSGNREIIKCLVTAGPNNASINSYGRSTVGDPIVNIAATVNGSYVELVLTPKDESKKGAKAAFHATYYEAHDPI